ncbi:SsgA family sporulation/cell division regulator [Kitasatospora sp. NPDC096147]|uniref:SsgA family sporulation/cell division regulator n=1 Tax=Kitasatospora sp. NPDC096147 TaxID=3364093 RepID=UPI0038169C72
MTAYDGAAGYGGPAEDDDEFEALIAASSLGARHVRAVNEPLPDLVRREISEHLEPGREEPEDREEPEEPEGQDRDGSGSGALSGAVVRGPEGGTAMPPAVTVDFGTVPARAGELRELLLPGSRLAGVGRFADDAVLLRLAGMPRPGREQGISRRAWRCTVARDTWWAVALELLAAVDPLSRLRAMREHSAVTALGLVREIRSYLDPGPGPGRGWGDCWPLWGTHPLSVGLRLEAGTEWSSVVLLGMGGTGKSSFAQGLLGGGYSPSGDRHLVTDVSGLLPPRRRWWWQEVHPEGRPEVARGAGPVGADLVAGWSDGGPDGRFPGSWCSGAALVRLRPHAVPDGYLWVEPGSTACRPVMSVLRQGACLPDWSVAGSAGGWVGWWAAGFGAGFGAGARDGWGAGSAGRGVDRWSMAGVSGRAEWPTPGNLARAVLGLLARLRPTGEVVSTEGELIRCAPDHLLRSLPSELLPELVSELFPDLLSGLFTGCPPDVLADRRPAVPGRPVLPRRGVRARRGPGRGRAELRSREAAFRRLAARKRRRSLGRSGGVVGYGEGVTGAVEQVPPPGPPERAPEWAVTDRYPDLVLPVYSGAPGGTAGAGPVRRQLLIEAPTVPRAAAEEQEDERGTMGETADVAVELVIRPGARIARAETPDGSVVIHAEVRMFLLQGRDGTERSGLTVGLRYSSDDPYAVEADFGSGGAGAPTWTFARDLLVEGARSRAGSGDVRVWRGGAEPGAGPGDQVFVHLGSPRGEARLVMAGPDLRAFLDASRRVVPVGEEHRRVGAALAEFEAGLSRAGRGADSAG